MPHVNVPAKLVLFASHVLARESLGWLACLIPWAAVEARQDDLAAQYEYDERADGGRTRVWYPLRLGPLAQWQSIGLLIRRFWVRVPGGLPKRRTPQRGVLLLIGTRREVRGLCARSILGGQTPSSRGRTVSPERIHTFEPLAATHSRIAPDPQVIHAPQSVAQPRPETPSLLPAGSPRIITIHQPSR